jgi:glycerol kinase
MSFLVPAKIIFVRAALRYSIPFQIKDVIPAMEKDAGLLLKQLNTDGGMTSNNWLMHLIADILNKQVNSIGMPCCISFRCKHTLPV